jgi:hypothetical protein
MPRLSYTANFKEKTGSTTGEEPFYLLEISHPDLEAPGVVRVVNDTQDLVHLGNTFTACGFRVQFPEDVAQTMPRVPISIDNIGRELTSWLDASSGGKGAQVRIIQVMRDTPDVIEQEYAMTLLNTRQDIMEVSGELGYGNMLDMSALAILYSQESASGLF